MIVTEDDIDDKSFWGKIAQLYNPGHFTRKVILLIGAKDSYARVMKKLRDETIYVDSIWV